MSIFSLINILGGNASNYYGLSSVLQQDRELSSLIGEAPLENQRGGMFSLLGGFLEGTIFRETFSNVGEGNKMSEIGQMVGGTVSSFIPLLAGLFSPPVAMVLLGAHGVASLTSGVKALGKAFTTGGVEDMMSAFSYFLEAVPGLGKIAGTAFGASVKNLAMSQLELRGLDKGIKSSLAEYAGKNGLDSKHLFAELSEQQTRDFEKLSNLKVKVFDEASNSSREVSMREALRRRKNIVIDAKTNIANIREASRTGYERTIMSLGEGWGKSRGIGLQYTSSLFKRGLEQARQPLANT